MIRASGILFITPDKRVLFLKRAPSSTDYAGWWDLPGGGAVGNETAEQTARRETEEELGFLPSYLSQGSLVKHIVTKMQGGSNVPSLVPADPLPMVEFTTFVQRVEDSFEPRLSPEHTAFAWASIDDPPQPLHPGVDIAIKKFGWNELDVARAIRDGVLPSPQEYENMWLFALRITGTGTAFRRKHDEFVLRKPELYLNEEFLARCNGLAVIVEHPPKAKLDSREYIDRNIGSIMLPYIGGEGDEAGKEVWGIAKIYDATAAEMMQKHQLSTSPSVVLRPGENLKVGLSNGKALLIEGEPKLLDHLAICTVGVWDKGEDPSGVQVEAIGDSAMADEKTESKKEEEKKDSARKDEHIDVATEKSSGSVDGQTLDNMLSKLDDCMKKMDAVADHMGKRMDAMEGRMDSMAKDDKHRDDKARDDKARDDSKKRDDEDKEEEEKADAKKDDASRKDKKRDDEEGEAKEVVADKKRKDDDARDDKKRDDAVADADEEVRKAIAELSKKIPGIEARLPQPISDADRNTLSDTQARADNVFAQFGERAPHPLWNETPLQYRRRIAKALSKHSTKWKDRFDAVADSAAFDVIEADIYSDAMIAGSAPDAVPEGMLREVTRTMPNGSKETKFIGHPSAWMNNFIPTRRALTQLNPKPYH